MEVLTREVDSGTVKRFTGNLFVFDELLNNTISYTFGGRQYGNRR